MDGKPVRLDLTFIVRVSCESPGPLSGIVERARTGEKHRFRSASGVATLIERMVEAAAERKATEEGGDSR